MNNHTPKLMNSRSAEHGPAQKVRLVLLKPEAQEVFVAGSFNSWNPSATPLSDTGHGRWVKDLCLLPGRYEYQFVVDGRWMPDRGTELVENPFGGINSILEVHRPQFKLTPVRHPISKINPKWSWHYRTLLKLRDRLLKDRVQQISEAAEPLRAPSMHLADSATDELDHQLAIAELNAEQSMLYEVDQAIRRILDGTYGKCERTGKPIQAARLRAVPWSPFAKEA